MVYDERLIEVLGLSECCSNSMSTGKGCVGGFWSGFSGVAGEDGAVGTRWEVWGEEFVDGEGDDG